MGVHENICEARERRQVRRLAQNQYRDGRLWDGYDYENQAWVKAGKYRRCGHPDDGLYCDCYGKLHEGRETPEILEGLRNVAY